MKHYQHIFGVDISKKTIDIAVVQADGTTHKQFGNDSSGMEMLLQWLQEGSIDFTSALFCMEATGLYCFTLTHFLAIHNIDIWIEHAAQIKKATALARGKSDKVDARRIAVYAAKNLDLLRLWKPMDTTIEKIKHLASLRERMVETQKRLLTPIKEFEQAGNANMAKLLVKAIRKSVAAIQKDITSIEATIIQIVNGDENLRQLYKIVSSVIGIGFVTAINLIIHTNGFTHLKDVRKLACYCGVAPFEYSSGTSIRGKTRVHYMANKKLKCNLHMASLSAIKLDKDLKAYYERKVGEGKAKMSVLNAVKNKLLARVIAVVNKQQLYIRKTA